MTAQSDNKHRHLVDPRFAGMAIEDIGKLQVARFRDKTPDWAAFEDAKREGFRRAQHRFIGAGGSQKHHDSNTIVPLGFTLSVMYLPTGQGNAAHTHEVEEVFFVLQGLLDVFLEDDSGNRFESRLGPWECISCPPGIMHGFHNNSLEPVYFQVMLGKSRPDALNYQDESLRRAIESATG